MAASIRVYVKKQIRVDRLSFGQVQMLKLGNVALAARKNDIAALRTPTGEPVKPLTKRYAIRKSRNTKRGQGGGRNVRDLRYTGDMLRNWLVRTVSDNKATASWSTLKDRQKALSNKRIQDFIAHSPGGIQAVRRAGQLLLNEAAPRLLLGGRGLGRAA